MCLAALGQGWGIRFIWSVAANCIPLLPESRLGVSYYFEGALNWTVFALPRVPLHTFPQMPAFLESVGDNALALKHESLRHHRRLFLWNRAQGGLAFEMTMRELCIRYRRIATCQVSSVAWVVGCRAQTAREFCQAQIHSRRSPP